METELLTQSLTNMKDTAQAIVVLVPAIWVGLFLLKGLFDR